MLVSMVLPLVQLIILGNAFGGKIRDAQMGVVDLDHGTQAVKLARGVCRDPGQCRHLPGHVLRQRSGGEGRCPPRQAPGRDHHSARVSRASFTRESSPHRRDCRQHRQLHRRLARSEDAGAGGRAQPAHGPAAHPATGRAGDRRTLSVHRVHEVPAAGLDLARHVHLGDDRRRDALHRRQGPRCP